MLHGVYLTPHPSLSLPPFPDTEGSFVVERVAEIATAAVHHLNTVDHEHTCDDQGIVRRKRKFK